MIRAVDFSEFGGLPPQSWFDALRPEHGVEAVIAQAWGGGSQGGRENVYLAQSLQRARQAGLKRAVYVWPGEDIEQALAYMEPMRPLGIDFVALDYESTSRPAMSQVRAVERAGYQPVIYTYPSYWRDTLGNPTEYKAYPLWLARYPRATGPVYWPSAYNPFGTFGTVGGWTRADGWQFQGTTQMVAGGHGHSVDLNLFERWPSLPMPPQPAPIPPEEEDEEDMRAILIKSAQSPDVYAWNGTKIAKVPSMTHVGAGLLNGIYRFFPDLDHSIRVVSQSFIDGLLQSQAER